MDSKYSIEQAVLTAGLSLSVGLIVFVFGQLFLKVVIEPLSEHRKIKSQVSQVLVFYANLYINPAQYSDENLTNEIMTAERTEASLQLRKLASEYIGSLQVIPWYAMWQLFRVIPSRQEAKKVSSCLIGLSNGFWGNEHSLSRRADDNEKRVEEIIAILKLRQ